MPAYIPIYDTDVRQEPQMGKKVCSSSDRIIVTPEFERQWKRHGFGSVFFRLLELQLVTAPFAGNALLGRVPYVRTLPWPPGNDDNFVGDKTSVLYIHVSDEMPIFLLTVLNKESELDAIFLDPERAAHFWERVNMILELFAQSVT